jgi:OOP family OmpA-OmpF porin
MADRAPAPDDRFAELRAIIVGPEQRRLRALKRQLRDPAAQTREVSRVLPDALHLRAHDPQLMRALAPSVEDAISASVKKNPHALADALFPVIGPAIRKAVAHTFDAMLESLNQSIERSVSWQAVRWRWLAWRTGKPFAEIVLAHTLDYRVEQVFLVHRESGLLLQHVALDQRHGSDADQISAMLSAITDFARDSFHVGGSETLDSMRVGDLAVSIARGPYAILAAVVRGSIPPPVRSTFESALESVHRQFTTALQTYNGDAAAFAGTRPLLAACLVTQRRRTHQRPSYRGWAIAAAAALVALAIWLYVDLREQRRWNAYLERLSAEPGVVLLASGRRGGSYFVTGLRDPLARDPAELLAGANLATDEIRTRWEPYEAMHPPFVVARAALLLRPPGEVVLTYADGVLTATGSAPQHWLDETARLAPAIAGVRQFRYVGETVEAQLTGAIQRANIRFAKGQSTIEPTQQATLQELLAQVQQLDAALTASRRRARLEVLGYADSDGPDDLNNRLSQSRADRVRAVLDGVPFAQITVSARGLGRVPLGPNPTEAEHEQNRRVSFRVHLTEDLLSGGNRQ